MRSSSARIIAVIAATIVPCALVVGIGHYGWLEHQRADSVVPSVNEPGIVATETPIAYTTERQLVVLRGTKVVAHVPRLFGSDDPFDDKVVWTNSGKFVAFLSDAKARQQDLSLEKLVAVDSWTGRVQISPCPFCSDLAPIGDNSILVSASLSQTVYLSFDLQTSGRAVNVDLQLPSGGEHARLLLIGTRRSLITQQGVFGRDGDYYESLLLSAPDGSRQTDLGAFRSNDYMYAAAIEQPDGHEIHEIVAVAFRPRPGECTGEFPVYIFTINSGHAQKGRTDFSGAQPPGSLFGVNSGFEMGDLWWGRDGDLRASIATWTCDESRRDETSKKVLFQQSAIWILRGQKWIRDSTVPTATTPITMARQPDDDELVALSIPDCIGPTTHPDPVIYCRTGTLYRLHGRTRTEIATGVLSLSSPRSQAR
jgi:hypothetical protein